MSSCKIITFLFQKAFTLTFQRRGSGKDNITEGESRQRLTTTPGRNEGIVTYH